jgi:hypothetical protein
MAHYSLNTGTHNRDGSRAPASQIVRAQWQTASKQCVPPPHKLRPRSSCTRPRTALCQPRVAIFTSPNMTFGVSAVTGIVRKAEVDHARLLKTPATPRSARRPGRRGLGAHPVVTAYASAKWEGLSSDEPERIASSAAARQSWMTRPNCPWAARHSRARISSAPRLTRSYPPARDARRDPAERREAPGLLRSPVRFRPSRPDGGRGLHRSGRSVPRAPEGTRAGAGRRPPFRPRGRR